LSLTAIALILVAAIAHASWNLFSKQASAMAAAGFIWLVAVAGSIGYAPVAAAVLIAGRPHLTAMNWAFLAGTGILQSGYFLFLQRGYRIGDLSLVYPVGRGTGALLAALAGVLILGERPGPAGIAGIGLIISGVLVLSIPARKRPAAGPSASAQVPAAIAPGTTANEPAAVPEPAAAPPAPAAVASAPRAPAVRRRSAALAVTFATLTGMFIASYTLWDKHAVTNLHTPPLLQGYAAFPMMVLAFAPLALRDKPLLARVWRRYRLQVLGAAVLAPLAYILVLIALSFTAVSAVAPAREVSVLFGVLLGGRLLGEGGLTRRLAGAAAIVTGIVAVAVG
jgi:drug/metabolite transporter (DMT)-like permease